jgi:predicted component of type VI protein secretion system
MTQLLRIFVFDGSEPVERCYSRFPVRLGRHPRNECQVVDTRVSRFHALFDRRGEALIVRDVDSQNGTVLLDGTTPRILRGAEAIVEHGSRLALLVGGIRVQARLERDEFPELPDSFAPTAREAARALFDICPLARERSLRARDGLTAAQAVLDSIFEGLASVRIALADGVDRRESGDDPTRLREPASALLQWTQATVLGLRVIEHAMNAARAREAHLLAEAVDAVGALLHELAPDRVEREAYDATDVESGGRSAVQFARYKSKHRGLVQRHARDPSALLGERFAELHAAHRDDRVELSALPPPSEKRVRLRDVGTRHTSADAAERSPSSH